MDSTELRYELVSPGMKDLDRLTELYNSAFPAAERALTVEDALEMLDDDIGEGAAVYDGDVMVGFYAVSHGKGYKCLQFLAVDPNIRSKGYGGIILRKLLNDNKDTVFFASIENPVPDSEDFEIKSRRRQFYERNGMITVDRSRLVNGVEFIVVTNKTGDDFERCYEIEVEEEKTFFDYMRLGNSKANRCRFSLT